MLSVGLLDSHRQFVELAKTLPHKTCQNRGQRQTHAAPLTSAPWRTAHLGERRAVAGASAIGEQVASERSKQATCRGHYSCCTVFAAILFVISLQICYVWIFECLVGLTFEWGRPIFRKEGSRK